MSDARYSPNSVSDFLRRWHMSDAVWWFSKQILRFFEWPRSCDLWAVNSEAVNVNRISFISLSCVSLLWRTGPRLVQDYGGWLARINSTTIRVRGSFKAQNYFVCLFVSFRFCNWNSCKRFAYRNAETQNVGQDNFLKRFEKNPKIYI